MRVSKESGGVANRARYRLSGKDDLFDPIPLKKVAISVGFHQQKATAVVTPSVLPLHIGFEPTSTSR